MSQRITLDQLNDAMETKYGSLFIEGSNGSEVEVRNLLRVPREDRAAVRDLIELINADDEKSEGFDEEEIVYEVMRHVVATPGQFEELKRIVGDDMAKLIYIFEQWMSDSEPGEASPSQN